MSRQQVRQLNFLSPGDDTNIFDHPTHDLAHSSWLTYEHLRPHLRLEQELSDELAAAGARAAQ